MSSDSNGSFIDLRKYNIKNEDDAIAFLELIESKAPQLKKVLKDVRLKHQSLISRAEFAEGKTAVAAVVDQTPTESPVGDRITGRAGVSKTVIQQSRVAQLQKAQAAPAPALTPAAPAPVVDESMTTAEDDDPLNLPPASELVEAPVPAGPGQIGQLPVAPPVEQQVALDPAAPANAALTGPVDLMALAQAQDEEETAAAAGTTPSQHASDDGVQSPDQPPTTGAPVEDTVAIGDRAAQANQQV